MILTFRFRFKILELTNLKFCIVNIHTATDFFNISYVKGNIFDLPAGTYRGIADGFFVFLKPLSVGNHELQIKTSVTNPTTPSYNYASKGIYNLKISPKSRVENNINQTNQIP
ncbi:MAG: hypothetical protein ACP5OH_05900 [Nitrososphaerota archaeon]